MELDPNRIYVVNAYTRKVYGDFELDIDARQFMSNNLLKQTDAPIDSCGEIPTLWCYDARGTF